MRKILLVAALAFSIAGCQTYSDTPSRVMSLTGDYKAIADCYYLKVANPRGFQKVDLDSMKTVTITSGSSDVTVSRMDFVGVSAGKTEVRYFSGQAFGLANWEKQHAPLLRACAS